MAPKLISMLFKENGALDPGHVGKTALELAAELGVDAPANTKVLMIRGKGFGKEYPLAKEKLCPVIQFYPYTDFEEALAGGKTNLLMEGAGHTAVVYSNCAETIRRVGEVIPVGRVVVNQGGSASAGGNFTNGVNPTMSLGCGSWGNNSISENLSYKHLMNVTKIAYLKKDGKFPDPKDVWGE
jgi:succinate-semialdehyde dehydrogenase